MSIGLDDVTGDLAKGKDWALARLATNPHRQLIDDTVKKMEWWACFKDEKPRRTQAATAAPEAANSMRKDASSPYKRTAPKIGRNDPCPCASGKKFKKCCGQ
jgi:uncharacterized protein YecA (UPF0149 family)